MEGLTGSSVRRGVRSCWARRGTCNGAYQRLPRAAPTTTPPGRGTRLGRRTVLGRLRRCRATAPRWSSPLQLLNRILDTYISSRLSQPLKTLKAGVSSAAATAPAVRSPSPSSSPPKLRRDASTGSSSRRRDAAGGKGVMLNICVAEVLLLRRSTSEVRRSPLQRQPTKDARRSSVRA